MHIFHNLKDWQSIRQSFPPETSIGFIPTLGNLHIGHRSLYQKSLQDNDCTVASIFVNPTQFNQTNDYTLYPRTLDADVAQLKDLGVDYCLVPDASAIYADNYRFQIEEKSLSQILEGPQRPGHFTGMLTVVMRLLNLIRPHRAYFGEKDYQQYQLVREMASAFFMNVDVIACPTVREKSGLPYSSRNARLTPQDRQLAEQFARTFHQPELTCEALVTELNALGITVEYLEEYQQRRFVAVQIGNVRLIDNYRIQGASLKT